jgi:hypothetical protein
MTQIVVVIPLEAEGKRPSEGVGPSEGEGKKKAASLWGHRLVSSLFVPAAIGDGEALAAMAALCMICETPLKAMRKINRMVNGYLGMR